MRDIISPLDGITSPLRRRSGGGFTPSALFSSGEQGAWYDPSDFSTMFQDSAGTTPVTAVEQPVGLLLDKSKGLALGAELVTNGDFSSGTGTTGWTPSGCTQQIVGSELETTCTVAGFIETNATITTVVGSTYTYTANVRRNQASGTARVTVGGIISGASVTSLTATIVRIIFKAVATTTTIKLDAFGASIGDKFSYSTVSVRELPGNHASQSTAASRPVLSARVNQVEFSEQFDNAYWAKDNFTVANTTATTDPLGGTTADVCTPTAVGAAHRIYKSGTAQVTATSCTYSLSVKANGYTKIGIRESATSGAGAAFDLSGTGSVIGAYNAGGSTVSGMAITPTGNNWFRIVLTISFASATAQTLGVHALSPSYTAGSTISESWLPNGTDGYYIWGADLRVTNVGVNLPAYQRVAAATDYDTSGFPLYLKFDGTDDSLATGTIDPGSVDKAQVFAGVRKLSDPDDAILAEIGTGSANGSFYLGAPVNAKTWRYSFQSRGTIGVNANVTAAGFAAPATTVVSGLSDISGDVVTIRANGVQQAQTTTDQGTGNYLSYPLYIGRRGGSSLPFNGQLYSMILRFSAANLSDAQIASTETYVNNLTKAY